MEGITTQKLPHITTRAEVRSPKSEVSEDEVYKNKCCSHTEACSHLGLPLPADSLSSDTSPIHHIAPYIPHRPLSRWWFGACCGALRTATPSNRSRSYSFQPRASAISARHSGEALSHAWLLASTTLGTGTSTSFDVPSGRRLLLDRQIGNGARSSVDVRAPGPG